MKKLLPFLPIVFFLAVINFAAFFVVACKIGGDALSGKVENGHYFLGSHGRLTEVSASLYHYSAWHACSLLITHPLGLLAGATFAMWLRAELRITKVWLTASRPGRCRVRPPAGRG